MPVTHKDMHWTRADKARHKATRDKYQAERPSLSDLVDAAKPSDVFTCPYPFVKSTWVEQEEDGQYEVPCWRPGVHQDPWRKRMPDDGMLAASLTAEGTGSMIVTVVSVHKPGKYRPRVFYTRKWQDPNGKTFGSKTLFVKTARMFKHLVAGYRYAYTIKED